MGHRRTRFQYSRDGARTLHAVCRATRVCVVLQRTIGRFDESRELSFAPARGGISTIQKIAKRL
jgi:hypothetical protein